MYTIAIISTFFIDVEIRVNRGQGRELTTKQQLSESYALICTMSKKYQSEAHGLIAHLIRFLNFVNVFLLFCNYLPLEKGMALHLNELEFLHSRMFCAKFGWNWPSGSGEEIFL